MEPHDYPPADPGVRRVRVTAADPHWLRLYSRSRERPGTPRLGSADWRAMANPAKDLVSANRARATSSSELGEIVDSIMIVDESLMRAKARKVGLQR